MSKFSFLVFILLISNKVIGQERWSLMKCIEYANKNNVSLQQSKISIELDAIDLKESRHKMLPNLNGNLNGGISFGRNVDPTTNAFTTQDILYSNYSLSTSTILFQGGLIRNSIKQNKLNLESSTKDYEQAINDLALSISTYYLNVLLSQEKLEIANKNRDIVKIQLDQINKLIKVGVKPEADALEIQSQMARTEQTFVLAENALELSWLLLKQSLRLDPETKITIEPLNEDQLNFIQLQTYTYEDLLNQASQHQAGIQAAKIRLESAKLGEKISRSLYYPAVFFNGSFGSRYSDAAFQPKDYVLVRRSIPGVFIDQKPVVYEQEFLSIQSTEVIPFSAQFNQFLGYGAGISVNIPIFNNYSANATVQRAKLNTLQSEILLELQKEKLGQDIYQAMANVKSAIKEMDAAKNAFLASKSSFEKTQKRFDIGTANVFELNQIQANFLNAETNFLISKYDLVFKLKVLDYYAGKEIKL